MSEKINFLKDIFVAIFLCISTVAAKRLSIKDNLSHFEKQGSNGPLSWGFLSPFVSKEHCFVQYKAMICSKSFN